MVMVMDTILDMVMATMDTMAKDLLKQSLDMDTMVMDMDMVMAMDMVMDTMDTMARDLLRLNLAMDTMVMDMDMGMDMATMDTMARDPPRPSLDMDTTVMDMDTGTAMAMVMDTMDKQTLDLEFSTNEVGLKFSLVKSTLFSCLNKS